MPDITATEWWTIDQVSAYLNIPVATLRWWRARHPDRGPQPRKFGRGLRWNSGEVAAWADQQEQA